MGRGKQGKTAKQELMRDGGKLTVFLLHLAIAGTVQGHAWAEFRLLVKSIQSQDPGGGIETR
jgi:hypothetical protein